MKYTPEVIHAVRLKLCRCLTKGFAYGLELGFMESVSTSQSKSITVNSNNQSSLTGDGTDKAEQSERENLAFIPSAPNDYSPSTDVNYSADSGREEHMDLSHEENSLFDSAALPTTSRSLRWCNEISSRARLVPTKNIDSFDFDKEVRELRGLYKLCGSTVGLFRPTTTDRTDSRIVDPAKKSNEW